MEIVECLNRQNVEPCATIDEGPGDLYVVDDWGTEHWEDPSCCCALELIRRAECDGTCRSPERVCVLKLGEDYIHLASKLLEDAL